MSYIELKNVTKDYGSGKGLFDVSFNVEKGETVGIVGINGAGKTTLLRHLMGFIRQDSGEIVINGLDPYKDAKELKKQMAYIPGEINFPSLKTGDDFIKFQAEFWNKPADNAYEVVKEMELDSRANLKRMSKGMKQKTAIAVSFIPDNDILIFDEPSTGLDPLMRKVFIEFVEKEKAKGKTIIMSSHMFDELEECSDRVVMLKNGRIMRIVDVKQEIKYYDKKRYKIEFENEEDFKRFASQNETLKTKEKHNQVEVRVDDSKINEFMKNLSSYKVKFIKEIKPNLEDVFLKEYEKALKEEENV